MGIVNEVESYVIQYFEEHVPETFVYHSIEHLRFVANMARAIGEAEGLANNNLDIVVTAAWFHDVGYSKSSKEHEEESCRIARGFLESKGAEEGFIAEVEGCIRATKFGVEPNTLNENILSDADLSHTGMENFMDVSNLYRKEVCNLNGKKQSKQEYWEKTLSFIEKVRFYTDYAKENLEPLRITNIEKVKKRLKKIEMGKKNLAPNQNAKSTARGTETMFRLTARNQINLSSIADNKANIMLTINSVLVSVLVSTSAINFNKDISILVPGMILIVACLISLVFAILSVRPKISTGRFAVEDLKKKDVNLLFFGNFYDMPYKKYESGIKEMINDYDFLYNNLIKDQYNLGKVLSQKYRLLTIAYNFFMYGFILAVLTFFVFHLFIK